MNLPAAVPAAPPYHKGCCCCGADLLHAVALPLLIEVPMGELDEETEGSYVLP